MARELGMTRAELITRMSSSELIYWAAYLMLEQQDIERARRRARNRQAAQQLSHKASSS